MKINRSFEQLDDKTRQLDGLLDSNERKKKITGFEAESKRKLVTKIRDVVRKMKDSFRQDEYGQIEEEGRGFRKTQRMNLKDLQAGKCE